MSNFTKIKIHTKTALKYSMASLLVLVSVNASAARLGEAQFTYWGKLMELAILIVNSAALAVAIGVLIAAVTFFVKDYILAKSDHDKKFSIKELIFGVIAATLLAVPTSTFLLGQDLTSGDKTGKVPSAVFEKAGK